MILEAHIQAPHAAPEGRTSMETFKYITRKDLQNFTNKGFILPRKDDGSVYLLPEDPLVWGVDSTREVLDYIQRRSGSEALVLLRVQIEDDDPRAFVQEADFPDWDRFGTRIPLKDYKRENFMLPEVIVKHPITMINASVEIFPPEFQT